MGIHDAASYDETSAVMEYYAKIRSIFHDDATTAEVHRENRQREIKLHQHSAIIRAD